MDRKSIIILVVSAVLLALWYPITNRIFPPKPAPPARTNNVVSTTNPAANRDARLTSPGTSSSALPAPVTQLPPREERTLTLESADARYVFTSIGGGFKQIELKRFLAAVDCSANDMARATTIRATRKWRSIVMLGEGGRVEFNPSPDIIHDQKTIYGSWVTSTWLMEELVERLVRWNLHPEALVTHRFELDRVADAYTLMAAGECGKVAVCFDEELQTR